MKGLGWLVLAALAACGSEAVVFSLPESAKTLVTGEWNGSGMEARAADGRPIQLSSDTEMLILVYSETLGELDLAEGPVEPLRCGRACALLNPVTVLEVRDQTAGKVDGAFAKPLMRALVPDGPRRCEACSKYSREEVRFSTDVNLAVNGSVTLGDGSVLFASEPEDNRAHTFWRVSPDLEVERVCELSDGVEDLTTSGGSVWVATRSLLLELSLEAGPSGECTVLTSTTPSPTHLDEVSGSGPGEEPELFILDDDGRVFRRSADQTELLMTLESASGIKRFLTRTGPAQVLVASELGDSIRWAGGLSTSGRIDLGSGGRVRALEAVPGGVAIAWQGGRLGAVATGYGVALDSSPWSYYQIATPQPVEALGVAYSGLLLSLRNGGFVRIASDGTECGVEPGFVDDTARQLRRLGQNDLLIPDVLNRRAVPAFAGVMRAPGDECH